MSRGARVAADLAALLRARNALIWVVTREEVRAERLIAEAAKGADYVVKCWDCSRGVTTVEGGDLQPNVSDPSNALRMLNSVKSREVWIFRDLHPWLRDPSVLRLVRTLARELPTAPKDRARAMIILTPERELPPELAGATVVDWPLPDRAEIAEELDRLLGAQPTDIPRPEGAAREAAVDAAVGLTAEEAASCYAKSLIISRRVDPAVISAEKRRVVSRERVLEWHDPDPRGLDAVGGLAGLKAWLTRRRAALSQKARAFGLPAPKGMLLVGPPGCGKSLTAKAVASAWGVPLLRLDLGAIKSKWVGESEANVRRALATAEAVAPCVLWIDEIEKALGGAIFGAADGGVSADALGAVLLWMQERSAAVFVVATSNDVGLLPPELLRKGRFDEVFWVDLPTPAERADVLRAALRAHGRTADGLDLGPVVDATGDFTGAELASLVPDALFAAFEDGERAIRAEDLVEAARATTPLACTAKERIEGLRAWAHGRARPASGLAPKQPSPLVDVSGQVEKKYGEIQAGGN